MKDNNFNQQQFYNQFNQANNSNFMKMSKWMYIISFIFQWSILSMIINLFTLGIFRYLVFILFIFDGISMIVKKNKTIKAPSFILSKIWYILDHINMGNFMYKTSYYTHVFVDKITGVYNTLKNKISNLNQIFTRQKQRSNKYKKERNFNKFSDEIGRKVIVSYVDDNGNCGRKEFKYKDRLNSYLKMLNDDGYKDFTQYNVNPKLTPSYVVLTSHGDLVDVENNSVKLSRKSSDYKFIMDSWPRF